MKKLKKVVIEVKDFNKKLNCVIREYEVLDSRYSLVIEFGLDNQESYILDGSDIRELFNISKECRIFLNSYTFGDVWNPFKRCKFGIYYYKEVVEKKQ